MLTDILGKFNKENFKKLNESMSFKEYLALVQKNPKLARNSHQMIYDMIMEKGSYTFEKHRKQFTHYNFFDQGKNPIVGLEESLDSFVKFLRGSAYRLGPERRILLLFGPVGTAKSSLAKLIKRSMEEYSKTEEGAWYSFKWIDLPTGKDGIYVSSECPCQLHEDPLRLIPLEIRGEVFEEINNIHLEKNPDSYTFKNDADLDPKCKMFFDELMQIYNGDWEQVVDKHIRVIRKIYSEADRCGVATFQPKDSKNQDAHELTGESSFSLLPIFGDDANPKCFSFNGELCVGNRGMVEFIEMLKLQEEFLYDLLGAAQEQQIKPKKFSQISVDLFLLSHSNTTEVKNFCNNVRLEALRDRTVKIQIPYLLKWSDEIKVLEQTYGPGKVKQHIAPHTLEIAALWSVLTRLHEDDKITPVQKARLYNGEDLENFNEDSVKELHDKYPLEGVSSGCSIRYTQEKISNALCNSTSHINAFMVLNEIKEGLNNSPLITDKTDIAKYENCVQLAIEELDEILKNEVRKALTSDPKALDKICANYIDNLMAYTRNKKIRNKITQRDESPNERLMRAIETSIGVPQQGIDDFRRSIASFFGNHAHDGKEFRWDSHSQLRRAFENKLFEDVQDHIKISALNVNEASVTSPDIKEKIDVIKQRLIDDYGYNEESASDVLEYVSSIYARGSVAED